LQRLIDDWPKPDGFSLSLGGEAREQEQSFGALGGGFILALMLVYMVMAGQFESFVQPLVVMTAVPLAGLGAVLTMRATGTTLNLNSALGAIVLVGIVVNNAIVLVDYTNLLRRQHGLALKAAIIESARRRLRPILMTAATTILALLPVALASGAGNEAQAPLARVVVGGLTSSSLITLFVVPVLYGLTESLIDRWRRA
jgi:HAE1 family hydrophobic/amphiphilic exporter-1